MVRLRLRPRPTGLSILTAVKVCFIVTSSAAR